MSLEIQVYVGLLVIVVGVTALAVHSYAMRDFKPKRKKKYGARTK